MINEISVPKEKYNEIIGLFPEAWRDRLRVYTGEELFYAYMLIKFKPKLDFEKGLCQAHGVAYCKKCAMFKQGDLTYMGIRAKLLRYLKGNKDEWGRPMKPVPIPAAWAKLGRKFKWAFDQEMDQPLMADEVALEKLKENFNNKRVA